MSEIAFRFGETGSEVQHGNRIVFRRGERPEPSLYVDVSGCVAYDAAGESVPLRSLVGQTVTSRSALGDALALGFRDGSTFRCEPDPKYEAWQVVGGKPQYLVVCQPGGGLAVWDERYVACPEEAEQTVRRLFGSGWRVREVTEGGRITVEPEPSQDD